ncbi:MAG: aminotransferase class III-fold pyridoxal phosphate-dependent enzyme [Candidatus Thiodiazotropha sp.]
MNLAKNEHLSRLESTVAIDRNARLVSAKNEIIEISSRGETRKLIDFMSSYAAVNFGHMNPDIMPFDKINADLVSYFTPIEAENYASWLCQKLDKKDGRVLFQIGGTSAVSAALGLAQHNKPGKVIAIANGFHGLAIDALSASTIGKETILQESPIRHLTNDSYQVIQYGEDVTDWSDVSCLLFEPVQGAAGMIPLDVEWIKSLSEAARNAGTIVISDEIQCGYYRCGSLSYTVDNGINADIILFGKSMTNGLFPFAALLYDKRLEPEKWTDATVFAHTFQPSAVGMSCAYAVSQYLDTDDTDNKINQINETLTTFSDSLMSRGLVSKTNVLGPSLSMEFYKGTAVPIARRCFEEGVLITTGGANDERFRLMPPITISERMLSDALSVLEDAIKSY